MIKSWNFSKKLWFSMQTITSFCGVVVYKLLNKSTKRLKKIQFSFDIRLKLIGWGEGHSIFCPIMSIFTFPVRITWKYWFRYWNGVASSDNLCAPISVCVTGFMHAWRKVIAQTKISGVYSGIRVIFSAHFRLKVLDTPPCTPLPNPFLDTYGLSILCTLSTFNW